jgi:hypothetical protein
VEEQMSSKVVAVLCFAVLFSGVASAAPLVFDSSLGNLSASAKFELLGGNLQITLSNTSTADVGVPSEVLTALFFDIYGNPSLSPLSAVLGLGSVVWFGTTDPDGVVGGEWAYASGLSGAPGGAWQGISSAGFGLFGPHDLFPGTNLQGPASPDGVQYGITSAGDSLATGNQAVTGKNALIQSSVVFTLRNLPIGFQLDENTIRNVSFQYGTDLRESTFSDGTPEPASLFLVAPVILVWAAWRYRARVHRRA